MYVILLCDAGFLLIGRECSINFIRIKESVVTGARLSVLHVTIVLGSQSRFTFYVKFYVKSNLSDSIYICNSSFGIIKILFSIYQSIYY